MNASTLAACMGSTAARAAPYVDSAAFAMGEYGITSPSRQAAFLAQCGHETGGLQWMQELWGPTEAQKAYEGRADLGNVLTGDGYKYRGRGWIQITGRDNYKKAAGALCLNCVEDPDLIASPAYAPLTAAWWWSSHGLNELADTGRFTDITRRINGGLSGLDDRMARWAKAKDVLGVK